MSGPANLYAPPKARVEDVNTFGGEAEEIRQEHIKREAEIRAIGTLYYIGGTFMCLAAIGFLSGAAKLPANNLTAPFGIGYLIAGVLFLFVARGLRTLRPWARITTIVFAFLGLLGFPVGTLINVYILYLLFSAKGKRIFEPDYPEIVAETPHIKYKTSIVVWVLLGILVLLVAFGVLAALWRHH